MSEFVNPFVNKKGFGKGKADALWLDSNKWRVFLYVEEGTRSFDVEAEGPKEAMRAAWAALKEQREGKANGSK